MVFWVEKIIWSVYLGKISLCDIRKRTIPVWLLFLGSLLVYLHNGLENRDYCRNGTGDNIASPDKDDGSNRHGGRHCIDPVGKYMQRWTGIAYILSEPYLYISVFYDSLYA